MKTKLEEINKYITNTLGQDFSEILYKHKCYDLLLYFPNSIYFDKAYIKYINNEKRMHIFINECKMVFEKLDIPYAFFKGFVLSKAAYGNAFIRVSGDLDVLVSPQNVKFLNEVLLDSGFIQGTLESSDIIPTSHEKKVFQRVYSHQVVPYIKKLNSKTCPYICIDVNTNVMWGESKKRINLDELLIQRQKDIIDGFSFFKLDSITEFIVLCLHHYKDMNSIYLLSKGSLKLRLFVDIYRYVKERKKDLPVEQLCEKSRKLGVMQYVYFCLVHTKTLFSDPILDEYIQMFRNQEGIDLLNMFGLSPDEQKTWGNTIEERLFDPKFKETFFNLLDEKDVKKINLNSYMMK